eukprot:TRINITY_DN77_c0_g2_i2.p1 TRINITY_DN77_c0_g2~~TRINITY_DN77_c0_g2_i2.p1  ORF type:complete len:108 (-),score=25.73 TRINITY_DN77_c0_g2_i2:13-336(-)
MGSPSLLDGALQDHSALIQAILLDDLAIMEHVELLCRILASKHHDRLLATRVLGEEFSYIQHLVTHDDPAVLVGVVLGDLFSGDRHPECVESLGDNCGELSLHEQEC